MSCYLVDGGQDPFRQRVHVHVPYAALRGGSVTGGYYLI